MTLINNPAIVFRTQEGSESFNEETSVKHSALTNVEIDKNFHGVQNSAKEFKEEEEIRANSFSSIISSASKDISKKESETKTYLNELFINYTNQIENLPEIQHIELLYSTAHDNYSEKLLFVQETGEYYLKESNKDTNEVFGEDGYCNMNIGQQVQMITIGVEKLIRDIEE